MTTEVKKISTNMGIFFPVFSLKDQHLTRFASNPDYLSPPPPWISLSITYHPFPHPHPPSHATRVVLLAADFTMRDMYVVYSLTKVLLPFKWRAKWVPFSYFSGLRVSRTWCAKWHDLVIRLYRSRAPLKVKRASSLFGCYFVSTSDQPMRIRKHYKLISGTNI